MKVNAIWDLRICKDLMESSDISNELDALLDAVHCAHADHACINYCDDLFFNQLNRLMYIYGKSSIDSFLWNKIKEYLVRSDTAREKFKTSNFFNMLEDKNWFSNKL